MKVVIIDGAKYRIDPRFIEPFVKHGYKVEESDRAHSLVNLLTVFKTLPIRHPINMDLIWNGSDWVVEDYDDVYLLGDKFYCIPHDLVPKRAIPYEDVDEDPFIYTYFEYQEIPRPTRNWVVRELEAMAHVFREYVDGAMAHDLILELKEAVERNEETYRFSRMLYDIYVSNREGRVGLTFQQYLDEVADRGVIL